MPSDSELITNYINYVSAFRRPKTVRMYRWHIVTFCKFLHTINKIIDTCSAEDVLLYLQSKTTWSPTARKHFLAVIKTFFSKYYISRIKVGTTPEEIRTRVMRENEIRNILNIPAPKRNSSLYKKALSIQEVNTLLSKAHDTSYSDFCIIWMLLYFGFRKNELFTLNPSKDIIWKENRIVLRAEVSKTHSSRELYFNDYTKNNMISLLKKYGTKDKLIELNEFYLNNMLLKYDKHVGRHIHPHMFRYTFITEMQKSIKGKTQFNESYIIKMLAGHSISGTDMTIHYTSIPQEELKSAMLKWHYLT